MYIRVQQVTNYNKIKKKQNTIRGTLLWYSNKKNTKKQQQQKVKKKNVKKLIHKQHNCQNVPKDIKDVK